MSWLLNLLGIVLYFLVRFGNRTDKSVKFSSAFWMNDNWVETMGTLVVNVIIMLLMLKGGVTIDIEKIAPWMPDGISFVGDLFVYVLIGGFVSHLVYEAFKTKVKK
jgi:hypothetical protein